MKVYKRLEFKYKYESPLFIKIINLAVLILLAVIFIRGGFQLKPMRPADAFLDDNSVSGYLVLNTPYNIIQSAAQDDINSFSFMTDDKAEEITRKMFAGSNEEFIDSNYVFLRKHAGNKPEKNYNVVVIIMESWSALYSGSITGKKTYTPFFDSIAAKGMLYTNFFANGFRSVEALPSIFVSIPSVFNSPIISSSSEINKFRGIGSILKEEGYFTTFHHGAVTGSMGFNGFTKISGFDKYYGMEDYPDPDGNDNDGVWGIYDEPFFLKTANDISGFNEPFCSVIFSLSSHDPFKIPAERIDMMKEYSSESENEQSVRYSDHSLRKFFEKAAAEPWFKNTIFLITSDHTYYVSRFDFYSQYHIPMLIYSPGKIDAGRNIQVASHADILPTIIDLLGLETNHSSMGRSLLSNLPGRYAFEKFGSDYCIISDSMVLSDDFSKPYRLYNYLKDPEIKTNIVTSNESTAKDLDIKLKAFLQTSSDALKNDRVYSPLKAQ
jgi:phosphoglycerol transferase MdoB-like AlkP superfamily enzyme